MFSQEGGDRGQSTVAWASVERVCLCSNDHTTEMDVMWWNHHDTGILSVINRRETSVRENKGGAADRRFDQTCVHAADYYATGEEIEMRAPRRLTILTLASSSGGEGLNYAFSDSLCLSEERSWSLFTEAISQWLLSC